jgi:site-specific recombinase XerC
MLLADAVAAYVTERAELGEVTAATARQFAWRLAGLTRTCPQLEVGDLGRDHVHAWLRTLAASRPATRRGQLSTLKGFCRWAVDRELVAVDPTARIARVRDSPAVPRTLSAGRVKRLQMVLPDDRARLIVALMHQLGLRCVEIARLQVSDWDGPAGELRVCGKGGHVRVADVVDDLADTLDAWCAARPAGPVVGISAGRVSLLVSTWMAAAGIKTGRYDGVSAHALRHTAASDLLDGCGNVRIVQQFLGHASLATTDRYLRRHTKAEMRAAMRAARQASA